MFQIIRKTDDGERILAKDILTEEDAAKQMVEMAHKEMKNLYNRPSIQMTGPHSIAICLGVYKVIEYYYQDVNVDKKKILTQHILFMEGAKRALIIKGHLAGIIGITPKGLAAYDQLKASGFKPNRSVLAWMLHQENTPADQIEGIVELLCREAV